MFLSATQRRWMFWIGCIGTRVALAVIAKLYHTFFFVRLMAYAGILLSVSYLYLFFSGARKTGVEVGGGLIWWNLLRPIHALLWGTFSYMVLGGSRETRSKSWMALAADVALGAGAYLIHYSGWW